MGKGASLVTVGLIVIRKRFNFGTTLAHHSSTTLFFRRLNVLEYESLLQIEPPLLQRYNYERPHGSSTVVTRSQKDSGTSFYVFGCIARHPAIPSRVNMRESEQLLTETKGSHRAKES